MKTIRLVSTKCLPNDQVLRLKLHNIEFTQHNFIKITEPENLRIDAKSDHWIITSQNAWKVLHTYFETSVLKEKQFFCVGEKTRQAIEKEGCKVILQKKNAEVLALEISKLYPHLSFDFFCGNLRRNELPNLLNENQLNWQEHIIYHTIFDSILIPNKADCILFFSPSAIKSYFEQNSNQKETYFCIGETTGQILKQYTNHTIIANSQTIESVIDSVIKHYK